MKVEVTDIQYFCTHDGPGIRTTVFLKGCPLNCRWCHNPESISKNKQLFYRDFKCIGCGRCVSVCPNNAHKLTEENTHLFDTALCKACMKCTQDFVCPSKALEAVSTTMDVSEVIAKVCKDKAFYREKGGVTFSGGEPTFQGEAFCELLTLSKAQGLSVCVETCGFFSEFIAEKISQYADLVLFDVKDTVEERHIKNTGVPFSKIKENLILLDKLGTPTVLRCIMIPEENMDEAHLKNLVGLYKSLKNCLEIELLPYHTYGLSKNKQLQRKQNIDCFEVPKRDELQKIYNYLKENGCSVKCINLD